MVVAKIEEKKDNFWGIYYVVKYSLTNEKIFIRVSKENINNNTYFYLFGLDFDMGLKVFKFLNQGNYNYSLRELYSNALKQLFSFLKIFNITIKDLNYKNCQRLIKFLKGGNLIGNETKQLICTQRKNSTVKAYLDVFRIFINYLKIDDHILLKKSINFQTVNDFNNERYFINIKVNNKLKSPAYIKLDKYKELINIIREGDKLEDIQYEIIVRLMYEYGLRIGEVLGITSEDFIKDYKNNTYYIYLRNRATDKRGQICKRLIVPSNINEYDSLEYNDEGVGYWLIALSYEFGNLISYYLESLNSKISNIKNRKDVLMNIKADKVSNKANIRINHYIFLNKRNAVLLQGTWNSILRGFYNKAKIDIDIEKRKNNLNHKLRHSFAMIRSKEYGYSLEELRILLRHSNVSTAQRYLLPNQDEIEYESNNIAKKIEEYINGK